ncbi:MAG: glycosyltransferase [Bacteroidota bacterium]
MTSNTFSVLISVYAREIPDFLRSSLESTVNQTLIPNEIVLVKDGPLTPELERVVEEFSEKSPGLVQVVSLEKNVGLGQALSIGLLKCKNDIVARMDTDDICQNNRFEKQIQFLTDNPHIDLVGSNILEFETDPQKPSRVRQTPETDLAIKKAIRHRNPFNHMSVCFRKHSVLRVGNYRHMPYFEDYDLWIRMTKGHCQFHNLQENLILVRTANDLIGKRHGLAYARLEWRFLWHHFVSGFFSPKEIFLNAALRFPIRIIPKRILALVYSRFLRKKIS